MCTYFLVDTDVLLDRVSSLQPNTSEKTFLLGVMNNSNKIHLDRHNYLIDRLIELNAGDEGMIKMIEKCKI